MHLYFSFSHFSLTRHFVLKDLKRLVEAAPAATAVLWTTFINGCGTDRFVLLLYVAIAIFSPITLANQDNEEHTRMVAMFSWLPDAAGPPPLPYEQCMLPGPAHKAFRRVRSRMSCLNLERVCATN